MRAPAFLPSYAIPFPPPPPLARSTGVRHQRHAKRLSDDGGKIHFESRLRCALCRCRLCPLVLCWLFPLASVPYVSEGVLARPLWPPAGDVDPRESSVACCSPLPQLPLPLCLFPGDDLTHCCRGFLRAVAIAFFRKIQSKIPRGPCSASFSTRQRGSRAGRWKGSGRSLRLSAMPPRAAWSGSRPSGCWATRTSTPSETSTPRFEFDRSEPTISSRNQQHLRRSTPIRKNVLLGKASWPRTMFVVGRELIYACTHRVSSLMLF